MTGTQIVANLKKMGIDDVTEDTLLEYSEAGLISKPTFAHEANWYKHNCANRIEHYLGTGKRGKKHDYVYRLYGSMLEAHGYDDVRKSADICEAVMYSDKEVDFTGPAGEVMLALMMQQGHMIVYLMGFVDSAKQG